MLPSTALVSVVLLALTWPVIGRGQRNSTIGGVPILVPDDASTIIKDSYIVVFKQTASDAQMDSHKKVISLSLSRRGLSNDRGIKKSFNMRTLRGYNGNFDTKALQKIYASGLVDYIEAVSEFRTQAVQSTNVPYGLARLSHQQIQSQPYTYLYPSSAGKGATVYVIDTGIYTGHPAFGGRAVWGANFVGDGINADGNGHGTHCAGTIGSELYGVAKNVTLVAVKVLNSQGSGDNSKIINGIQWVVDRATGTNAIISMSLGGGYSQSLNTAVNNAVAAGIFVVVAAGNDNANAASYSPASAASALAVGAIDSTDTKASFSNYGSPVKIWGPGVNIISTYKDGGYKSLSGTSMATPHIAGLAALILAQANGKMSPAAIRDLILSTATGSVINAGTGSSKGIAYNGGEAGLLPGVISSSSTSRVPTSTAIPTTSSSTTPTTTTIISTTPGSTVRSTTSTSNIVTSTRVSSFFATSTTFQFTTSFRTSTTVRSSTSTSTSSPSPTPPRPRPVRCWFGFGSWWCT